ncbi:MAG: hypothetical protein MJ025_00925 [Victivallaceae bacterium]|nr:hypothetical protein [Victivallaceae bacterium]
MKTTFLLGVLTDEQLAYAGEARNIGFSGIEIGQDLLHSAADNVKCAGIRDIVTAQMAVCLPGTKPQMQSEFAAAFRKTCDNARKHGASFGTIGIDVRNILGERQLCIDFPTWIRSFAGMLDEYGLELLLPVRVPVGLGPRDSAYALNMLQELMYPRLDFMLDVHIGEAHVIGYAKFVSAFRMHRRKIRIGFDTGRGEQLDGDVLKRLFEALNPRNDEEFTIIISPGTAELDKTLLATLGGAISSFTSEV